MKAINKIWIGIIALSFIAIGVFDASAQDMNNEVSGKIYNQGTIRFKTTNGKFKNSNTTYSEIDNADGVIEFEAQGQQFTDKTGQPDAGAALGKDAASRVYGTVKWTSAAGTQNVQGRFYEILILENNAAKTVEDEVYIYRSYTAAGGARTYDGTFHYEGIASFLGANVDQVVFPEGEITGSTNNYNNLSIEGDAQKIVEAAGTVKVRVNSNFDATNTGGTLINGSYLAGTTTVQATPAPIVVDGTTALLSLGSDISTMDGTVNINGGGLVNTAGGGYATFSNLVTAADGTLNLNSGDAAFASSGTLALTSTTGVIDVDAERTLTMTGTFTNTAALGTRTNMVFHDDGTANALNSTIVYNGAAGQSIVGADEANPYSNVTVTGAGNKQAEGSFYMAGHLNIDQQNLDMATGDYKLTMTDALATATYGSGYEVMGAMERYFAGATSALTFNNEATALEVTDALAEVKSLTLNINPATNPAGNSANVYNAQTDVNRRARFFYDATANNWIATLKLGFKPSENPSNTDSLAELRFKEVLDPNLPTIEKIATGNEIQLDIDETVFNFAQLAGIRPDGALNNPILLAEVTNTHDIFLRGGPVEFISVRDGRWSNPATWDEGAEPEPQDLVRISGNTQVHTGFTRTAADDYKIAEATPTQLASKVTVDDDAALIFGYIAAQGGESPVAGFEMSNATYIYNNATSPEVTTDLANLGTLVNTAPAAYTGRGLIIYEGTILLSNMFENTGSIHNGGTIEVGKP